MMMVMMVMIMIIADIIISFTIIFANFTTVVDLESVLWQVECGELGQVAKTRWKWLEFVLLKVEHLQTFFFIENCKLLEDRTGQTALFILYVFNTCFKFTLLLLLGMPPCSYIAGFF